MPPGSSRCRFKKCFPGRKRVVGFVPAQRRRARSKKTVVGLIAMLAGIWISVLSKGVRGEAFSSYQKIGTLSLPAGAAMFDSLPDGRVITLAGSAVYLETAPASGSFAAVGNLIGADFPSFGAALLRVSPDGTRFAVGNNGGSSFSDFRIGVFNVSNLAGNWFSAAHYDAAWIDLQRLAITAGDFGSPAFVTVLDTNSPNPLDPDNRTVITGIGGASGGIAFDDQGNLYTGNGFTGAGPSGTGAIRAFSSPLWETAYASGPAVNFETQGSLVVDVLSASPLDFDAEGNLLVGGGDFSESSETDYVAVVRASAIAAALAGQGPANTGNPAQVRKLDPDSANDFNFFFAASIPALSRLYVKDSSETTVHVYLDTTGIPAVSTWGAVNLALLMSIVGSIALHRRAVSATP